MRRLLPLLLWMLCALPALAAIDPYEFGSEADRLRYLEFTRDLRCPKCQNQNLADSNAPIAQDLRHELQRLLREGRTDDEIITFMVDRYGEYVLYQPRLERKTLLLWGAPIAMLLGGLLVIVVLVRRARRAAGTAPQSLDPEERRQLERLLHETQENR